MIMFVIKFKVIIVYYPQDFYEQLFCEPSGCCKVI